MQYARLIKRWLDSSGLTPVEAAPRLGVSFQAIYGWVGGDSLPPATRVPALARILGVPEAKLRQVINRDRARRHAAHGESAPVDAIGTEGART